MDTSLSMSFENSKSVSNQNLAQYLFLDVKQNYVYKGLNLNLKEVK